MFKFFESKKGKDLMSKLYGWGASVVILGAMFKILHWDGADLMLTIGLTGSCGGEMNTICDIIIKVPSDDTPRIQEAHILIGHIICQLIEEEMF